MTATRCAIYTRKSSDEGLDQAFNSLHAQREACEAYVRSQSGEGWRLNPGHFDDGGFSGGTVERPALRALLDEVAAGRVDVVVVYKIDRLTRSLMDFARIVEVFDAHKVSFVSVTQAFNTTTSMGRLTLNVLLSFAQFEREVTGERIRDKIAASKARGMWMGGLLPLGYDGPVDQTTRALVVNAAEADVVRLIFQRYLELGSVHALAHWLEGQGVRSKSRVTAKGISRGGERFSRGALFHLLRNRVYLGMITHGKLAHPGAHPPIVDRETFEAVQVAVDANARRHGEQPKRVAEAPLKGRIFDADGGPMSPSFTHGARGQAYRYYVSATLQQGRRPEAGAIRRVSGPALEAKLAEVLGRLLPAGGDGVALLNTVSRVEVYADCIQMLLPIAQLAAVRQRLQPGEDAGSDAADPASLRLRIPIRIRMRGGRTSITGPDGGGPSARKRDPMLIRSLRSAHGMLTSSSGLPTLETAPSNPYSRKLVTLAFLAPDLQTAVLEGRQPAGTTLERLFRVAAMPAWTDQLRAFQRDH